MLVEITSAGNLQFKTMNAVRAENDPPIVEGGEDLPNPGVTVLVVDIPAGDQTVAIVFSPQWTDEIKTTIPKDVPLDSWNITSHYKNPKKLQKVSRLRPSD